MAIKIGLQTRILLRVILSTVHNEQLAILGTHLFQYNDSLFKNAILMGIITTDVFSMKMYVSIKANPRISNFNTSYYNKRNMVIHWIINTTKY